MSHTVTGKLNKAARRYDNQNGSTFFVSVGEKNYNFKDKKDEWTNYEAALFAKDAQVNFYESALIEGSIISISGTGLIIDDSNKDYKAKLVIQDAKLVYINYDSGSQQQKPASQPQQQNKPPSNTTPDIDFDDDSIPF